jgi:hypothetical protein
VSETPTTTTPRRGPARTSSSKLERAGLGSRVRNASALSAGRAEAAATGRGPNATGRGEQTRRAASKLNEIRVAEKSTLPFKASDSSRHQTPDVPEQEAPNHVPDWLYDSLTQRFLGRRAPERHGGNGRRTRKRFGLGSVVRRPGPTYGATGRLPRSSPLGPPPRSLTFTRPR